MAAARNTLRRAPLTDRQVEMMLAVFLRDQPAFEQAQVELNPDEFAPHHRGYALVWRVVLEHFDEFGELPDEETLAGELERTLQEDLDALNDDELILLDEFLRAAFSVPAEALRDRVAFKYLRLYREDRLLDQVRRDLDRSSFTPRDMVGLFAQHAAAAANLAAIGPTSVELPFEEGWDQDGALRVDKTSLQLPFLDRMLNGGLARGEVLGMLAPSGTYKTTFSIQISTDVAMSYRESWRSSGGAATLPLVYVFFYEGTKNEMRLRALAHAARIHKDSLEVGDPNTFSTADNLRPYERKLFRALLQRGRRVPGEQERYKIAQRRLNDNWRLLDMTGNDPRNPGRGGEMIDEIVAVLRADRRAAEQAGLTHDVGLVVVDYAGACVKRHIQKHSLQHDRVMRHFLGELPRRAKNDVAVAFNTPVIVLHQLNAKGNALQPGYLADGTDAAEARNFVENTDFLLIGGNVDVHSHAAAEMKKHRRTEGTHEAVMEIDGAFASVHDTDGQFVLDRHTRQIVDAQDLRGVPLPGTGLVLGGRSPRGATDDPLPIQATSDWREQLRQAAED